MSLLSSATHSKRARSRDRSTTPTTNGDEPVNVKRRRADVHNQHEADRASPAVGLLGLPVELLYSIHLYAKNPAFVLINKHVHSIFRACPTSIKARYLLARWHEAYCYGDKVKVKEASSTASSAAQRRATSTSVPNRPPLPATPSLDLLENGALPELAWTSRFLPVLPTSELPYPLNNSFQRSADHFVLDYCLRYGLTDLAVLNATEDLILRLPEFGNIVQATGLWRDIDGLLKPNVPLPSRTTDDGDVILPKPAHLRVTELPKRLFQSLRARRNEDDTAPQTIANYGAPLPAGLARHLLAFGNGVGPLPAHSSMMLLLSIAAQHVTTTSVMPAASEPFNSFDGLPLAKATFAKSAFMVQFLLALGAEPRRKGSLSIYIAIRSGWLDGLQQLVERDDSKMIEWQAALDGIRRWFMLQEVERRRGRGNVVSEAVVGADHVRGDLASESAPSSLNHSIRALPNSTSTLLAAAAEEAASSSPDARPHGNVSKRRRLLDRASLDSKMLKEAVKHNAWPVANWLRSKGLVPDLRTIKLIELKQGQSSSGGNRSGGNDTLTLT